MINNNFINRHNGPTAADAEKMLKVIGVASQEQLISEIISPEIRLPQDLNIGRGMNEYECISHLKALGAKNKQYRTYIGLGYYNTITPGVIMRNILETPGWYTSYTPYQAEVSQGRLEALLNFQTVISDLTAMPLANASLLDEGTAAAEAMLMFWHARSRAQVKAGVKKFFVANDVFPQTIEVIKTRAHFIGIEVVVDDLNNFTCGEDFFGILIQCPNQFGEIVDNRAKVADWKAKGMQVAVAADLLSLTLITPPGEWGADVVLGSNQRFGLPMGFGGPHAGSLPPQKITSAKCQAVSSVSQRMPSAIQLTVSPCKPANSISSAKKPHPTSALHRLCWPSCLASMPFTTARMD